jgi:hypothetical protein
MATIYWSCVSILVITTDVYSIGKKYMCKHFYCLQGSCFQECGTIGTCPEQWYNHPNSCLRGYLIWTSILPVLTLRSPLSEQIIVIRVWLMKQKAYQSFGYWEPCQDKITQECNLPLIKAHNTSILICFKIGMEKAYSSFVRPTANDSAA